jgi:ribonuclease BN (tRNA processing enzyme)
VQLTVLGAGPAYTNRPGATGAAYLIRSGATAILLDLGQGSFPRLMAALEPSELAAAFVSHLHPDHFIDLVPLRHYLRYEFDPGRRVRVFGPGGLDDRLDCLHGQPGFSAEALDVTALAVGSVSIDGLEVEARLVTHTKDSFAFRVAQGAASRGLVDSGDCGRADDLVPLIQPGDVLLSEVSFGPGSVPQGAFHLNSAAVGELASSTGVGRVLLTHLQMGNDERATIEAVRARFEGPVELVEPGTQVEI